MEELGVSLTPGGMTIVGSLLLIVVAFVFSVLKGILVPGKWVDKLLKDKDDQIDRLTASNDKLLNATEPTAKLIETMNEALTNREKN